MKNKHIHSWLQNLPVYWKSSLDRDEQLHQYEDCTTILLSQIIVVLLQWFVGSVTLTLVDIIGRERLLNFVKRPLVPTWSCAC